MAFSDLRFWSCVEYLTKNQDVYIWLTDSEKAAVSQCLQQARKASVLRGIPVAVTQYIFDLVETVKERIARDR